MATIQAFFEGALFVAIIAASWQYRSAGVLLVLSAFGALFTVQDWVGHRLSLHRLAAETVVLAVCLVATGTIYLRSKPSLAAKLLSRDWAEALDAGRPIITLWLIIGLVVALVVLTGRADHVGCTYDGCG